MPDLPVSKSMPGAVLTAGSSVPVDSAHVPLVTLEHLHPEYVLRQPVWQETLSCYRGFPWVKECLFQHIRESDEAFGKRQQRSHYRNLVKPIVDLQCAYVYRQPPARNAGDVEWLSELWDNVDRAGTPMDAFMRRALVSAQIFGDCPIVLTKPRLAAGTRPVSQQDEVDLNLYPYLVRFNATQLVSWARDPGGDLLWARLRQRVPASQLGPWDLIQINVYRYTTYSRDHWWIHDVQEIREVVNEQWVTTKVVRLIDEDDHSLGIVPVFLLYGARAEASEDFRGWSPINDIARANLAIYMWSTLQDECLHNQSIPILLEEDPPVGQKSSPIITGPFNTLSRPNGTQPQAYLEVPIGGVEVLQRLIEDAATQIYQMARMSGARPADGPTAFPSGVAAAWMFSDTNQALSALAAEASRIEKLFAEMSCQWMGESFEGQISYPQDFGISDFQMDLAEILQIKQEIPSATFQRHILKDFVRKRSPDLTVEDLDMVDAEIDEANLVPTQAAIQIDEMTGLPMLSAAGPPTARPNVNPRSVQQGDLPINNSVPLPGDTTSVQTEVF